MLYSEQMHQICEKLGVKREDCKDGLYSTLLQAICDACDGGGGNSGGGESIVKAFVEGTITEVSDDTVEKVIDYAFYGISALTTVSFPAATSIGKHAFYSCGGLTTVSFPAATSIGDSAFYYGDALTAVCFPAVTSIGSSAFRQKNGLTTADFPAATSIGNNAFYNARHLTALLLRNTETVCTLGNTSVFDGTQIKSGTGYIYVPAALIDSYKAATNWSTFAAQFRALEDYTVDGTTTGELDATKI